MSFLTGEKRNELSSFSSYIYADRATKASLPASNSIHLYYAAAGIGRTLTKKREEDT